MSTATTGRQLLDQLEKRVAELERKVKEFERQSSLVSAVSDKQLRQRSGETELGNEPHRPYRGSAADVTNG